MNQEEPAGKKPKKELSIYVYIAIAIIIGSTSGVYLGTMPINENPLFTLGLLPAPENIYPGIQYDPSDTSRISVSSTFRFQSYHPTLEIEPLASVYAGAKDEDSKHSFVYQGSGSEDEISTKYYLAYYEDPTQQELFAQLHAAFQNLKQMYSLTDDEYVELVTAYVQSLPYSSSGEIHAPKFPIETVVDKHGDCDDKSLLLSGILAMDGFDVALLYLDDEEHMGVGIKTDTAYAYPDADEYAYIETTGLFYVTEIPNTAKYTKALVIQIGNGTKKYHAGFEVAKILQAKLHAGETIQHYQNAESFQDVLRHNQAVEVYNLIASRPFDRKYVFSRVASYLKTT